MFDDESTYSGKKRMKMAGMEIRFLNDPYRSLFIMVSDENATPSKSTKSRISDWKLEF